ncbi:hypothetical protein HQ535_09345 [bacterium]|nr:hypothetical protein [bacterium]
MRPINLLPPEVSTKRKRRRRMIGVIALGIAYVALLVVGVVYWGGKVSSAESDVEAQLQVNESLQREIVVLSDAGGLREEFEAKADLVRVALADDVDWGILLNDLARMLPPRVWLREFTGTLASSPNTAAIGQVSFSGVGFAFPDISDWLRALDSESMVGFGGTWVSTMAESVVGESPVVEFSSTAILTTDATTNRAESIIPEVP